MEDTLREQYLLRLRNEHKSLNPCFNGRYSQRNVNACYIWLRCGVLILVLMEDTLRENALYAGVKNVLES